MSLFPDFLPRPVRRYLPEIVLLLLSFAVVRPHLTSFFTSDDFLLFEQAVSFHAQDLFEPYLPIPVGIFFRPLSTLFFNAVFSIGSFSPDPYHWTSFLIHSLNCVLFYRLLVLVFQDLPASMIALASAALVAVHPRTQEVIATVYCFPDLLVVMFSLASSLAFIHYLKSQKKVLLVLATLLYICALGSKENAIAAFPVVMLIGLGFLKQTHQGGVFKILIRPFIVFALAISGYVFIRFVAIGTFVESDYTSVSFAHILVFIAKGLSSFIVPISLFSALSKAGVGLVIGLFLLAVVLVLYRSGRVREWKQVVGTLCAAVVLLAPASMYSFSLMTGQENRFLYFALFPLSFTFSLVLVRLFKSKQASTIAAGLVVTVFLLLSNVESHLWRNAAERSYSLLTSYALILKSHQAGGLVLLDGVMYMDGIAVGTTPAALRMAPRVLSTDSKLQSQPIVLSLIAYRSDDAQPAVGWHVEGDTLHGTATTGRPVFLGPARETNGVFYLPSPPGLVSEARGFHKDLQMSDGIAIYPYSSVADTTLFLATKGVVMVPWDRGTVSTH